MLLSFQAAEKAAAQSNREISGYRIESISLTQERHTHYVRKQGMAGQVMGTAQEGLPDFECAEDFRQQWAGTPGTGFAGAFQDLSGQLGGGMPGFAMVVCPRLPPVCFPQQQLHTPLAFQVMPPFDAACMSIVSCPSSVGCMHS